MDATLIAASPSTKNKDGRRDPEMSQSKKGNQWYFGMKAHVGVDVRSGLVQRPQPWSACARSNAPATAAWPCRASGRSGSPPSRRRREATQVAVALLGYAAETVLPAGRVLLRHSYACLRRASMGRHAGVRKPTQKRKSQGLKPSKVPQCSNSGKE